MTWTLFLLAVLASVLGRVIGEDAKTLIPRFSQFLLRRAALRINGEYGGGFYEEWLAHLDETPELTLKLWHALSVFFWGAERICREIGYSDNALGQYDKAKRVFDVVLAVYLAPMVLVAVPIMAVAVRLSGCAPFVVGEFVGQNGRSIRVWKVSTFRRLKSREMDVFRRTDPRWRFHLGSRYYVIPPVGRFLRRIRGDELPLVWSVLRGDMSLIGPRLRRKPRQGDLETVDHTTVRPGVTGFSQLTMGILAGSESEKLDQWYCERRNLHIDFKIMWIALTRLSLR